jgi:hypothetical protein
MMGSLERIYVPLEIFLIATRPFPFPGISCKVYIELPVVLCIFMSPTPSEFPLFLFTNRNCRGELRQKFCVVLVVVNRDLTRYSLRQYAEQSEYLIIGKSTLHRSYQAA